MNPKIMSLIGLARRAGKVVIGDESCMKAIRAGTAKLVLLADDASANTKKKYKDKCAHYRTELVIAGDRNAMGQALGRSEQVAIAIVDAGFAGSIKACLEKTEVESID